MHVQNAAPILCAHVPTIGDLINWFPRAKHLKAPTFNNFNGRRNFTSDTFNATSISTF